MMPASRFGVYMDALSDALGQELPERGEDRAAVAIDDLVYQFRFGDESGKLFACCVLGALPGDPDANSRLFAELLHAQFCFSDSCGFSFGVDADSSFVLIQALIDTECVDERCFAALMEKFVQTANVWSKRIADFGQGAPSGEGDVMKTSDFAIHV